MTRKPKKITSGFCFLDVKQGRKGMARYLEEGGKPIPVTIKGHILYAHSGDDGTSIEFCVEVKEVKVR